MTTTTPARAMASATLLVAAMLTPLLGGCGAEREQPAPAATSSLLAEHDLDGLSTVQVIDRLDSLPGDERPADLRASVRPTELLVSGEGGAEQSLSIPDDRFYLSVAPYVTSTHDCFHHSLTTCQGELSAATLHVRVVDETHDTVLVEETRTAFDNGFTGFWLPRDIEGTVRVTYRGKTGEVPFTTDLDAPTCLTTLRLT